MLYTYYEPDVVFIYRDWDKWILRSFFFPLWAHSAPLLECSLVFHMWKRFSLKGASVWHIYYDHFKKSEVEISPKKYISLSFRQHLEFCSVWGFAPFKKEIKWLQGGIYQYCAIIKTPRVSMCRVLVCTMLMSHLWGNHKGTTFYLDQSVVSISLWQ